MLRFRDGRLVHAATGRLVGEEAFFEMARWPAGTFEEMPESGEDSPQSTIKLPLSQLMIEAARRRDEAEREASERAPPATGHVSGGDTKPAVPGPVARQGRDRHDTEEERHMALKDHLQEFTGIEGFKAAAVFTAQGEMLESEAVGKYDIKTAGMFANNALLNAQKATDQMGVGRGNLIQIRAPQASIMMRCLEEGKAHFHTLIVMDPEGNLGMAAMILDKVAGKIADELG